MSASEPLKGNLGIIRGSEAEWQPMSIPGVAMKVLRADQATGEHTVLLRFEPGTQFPPHNHPEGEQVFVLEGEVQFGGDRLKAGDYIYTPPNAKHAAYSEGGCLLLVSVPKPIEILRR